MKKHLILFLAALLACGSRAAALPPPALDLDFRTAISNRTPPELTTRTGRIPLSYAARIPQPDAGLVLDASANALHGSAQDGARRVFDDRFGTTLELDGQNGHVRIADSPALSFGSYTSDRPFSVAAWINMRTGRSFPIASKGEGREWQFGIDDEGRLAFSAFAGGGQMRRWTARAKPSGDAGQWHAYAVAYDGAGLSNSAALYRDGQPVAVSFEGRRTYQGMPDTSDPLLIGRSSGRSAAGRLAGIRIYAAALRPADIAAAARPPSAPAGRPADAELALALADAEGASVLFSPGTSSWTSVGAIQADVFWPADAPSNAQALFFAQDRDYYWFQNLHPEPLAAGAWNRLSVDLAPDTAGWEPRGHYSAWNYASLSHPRAVGLRLFTREPYTGVCRIAAAQAAPRAPDAEPPRIRNLRVNRAQVPCFEKLELVFELPDRYADPYDTNQVRVSASFESPAGRRTEVEGFFMRNFFREGEGSDERITPQGQPVWCVRYAPLQPGLHQYAVRVRDARGETVSPAGRFLALPPATPGFVRVSASDPRYFEFDSGSPFFPIGHNIRSPFDVRMDRQFPWRRRTPPGSTAYTRHFANMSRHGENMTEIWCASWSLGLEWLASLPGYRGVGQYNLAHAWELDRVVEEAERQGIHINLVLNNHGKFSTWCDEEWAFNPYNTVNGGYLKSPDEFFSDPRAHADFLKLMRYMVARWSYSTSIFSWELWSELDLTGTSKDSYRRPEVVEWHRRMAGAIKAMDPNRHLIGTHVCGDYTHQNSQIISLPEIDYCPNDAYHFSRSPLQIVNLLGETAAFNNPFGKPVLVTEFGGSPMAAGLKHLADSLHAGLWASVVTPVSGAPMFWWWDLIEEENLYPEFAAVAAFTRGDDHRGSNRVSVIAELLPPGSEDTVAARCMKDRERGFGWIYQTRDYEHADPAGAPTVSNLVIRLPDMTNGTIRVEFWNTLHGTPLPAIERVASNGVLELDVPPFARDIAFKLQGRMPEAVPNEPPEIGP